MIVVRLEGGLGNAMFEYALGRTLSLHNDAELKFDIESYRTNPIADCSFWLEQFNIDIRAHLATSQEIRRFKRYEKKQGGGVLRFAYNYSFADESKYIREKHYHFDASIPKLRGADMYLHGWWQSEKYFSPIRDTLLKDFTLRRGLPTDRQAMVESMRKTNSVSIHIRRLDYVSNPKTRAYHGELPSQYYQKALDRIRESVSDPVVYVFSDDIASARQAFSFPRGTVYVEPTHDVTGAEDMFLMSCCKHHIIANSSFSWWGAWLNRNPDKIVVAPTPWVADTSKLDTRDVVPESWIALPANYIRS